MKIALVWSLISLAGVIGFGLWFLFSIDYTVVATVFAIGGTIVGIVLLFQFVNRQGFFALHENEGQDEEEISK